MVRFQRDSALVRALVECDSTGRAHLTRLLEYRAGERVRVPEVRLSDNILTATATVDSMSIYLAMKDRFTERVRTEYIESVRTVEVNRLNRWQKFWMRTGQIMLLALTAGLFLRLRKWGR